MSKNLTELREQLSTVIDRVVDGSLSAAEATAIAYATEMIIESVKVQNDLNLACDYSK